MKYSSLLIVCCLLSVSAAFAQNGKSPYTFNREPLKQDVYAQLPLGSIRAKGWLLKQLQLQKEGFTGEAEELYPESDNLGANSDWLGGTGNSWEKVPYYVKGLVSLAYTLDDAELKARSKKWIDYTLDHQQENGLFGPPKMRDWWPRMPFMYALQSYYEATGDKRVIPFLSKYFRYELDNLDKDPLKEWGKSRAGDNMEIVLWVYNKTGDAYLLDLVNKLKQQAYPWADIFNQNQFQFYGPDYQPKHMVNVSQALKFPAVYSQVDPSPHYADAMQNGIKHILNDNGQPTGIGSGTEFMSGHNTVEGVETCTVVEWMQSLETGARIIHNNSSIGDQLEKLAFNTLPAQFSSDLKNHTYYTLPNQVQNLPGGHGFNQDYGNGIVPGPFSGFPCCRYNMHMGWPYFVKNSWVATPDGGLAVNAYAPMEVNAVVAQNIPIKIAVVTSYPFDEQIDLNFSLTKVASFGLKLRIPSWCARPEVKLNGKLLTDVVAGQILTVKRIWKTGDKISLHFPMQVAVKPQVSNAVSVERGPLVYAVKIKQSVKNVREYAVKGFYETEIIPASAWNYGLVLEASSLAKNFTVVKGPMPENPFVQEQVPVQLRVSARQIPAWTMDYNNTAAFDVPFGPVVSTRPTEQITLVPYGSESLRVSIIPIIGKPAYSTTFYRQSFDNNTATGLTSYGNGWFYKDNAIHTGANDNGLSGTNGPKVIATGTKFDNFVYTADIAVSTAGDAGLIFRAAKPAIGADAYEGYYAGLNAQTGVITLGKSGSNKWTVIETAKYPMKINETYKVKVRAMGSHIEVFLSGADKPLISATDGEYKSGNIGLRVYNAIATMDNLEVNAL
ncbi:beta-L-arabinofuranosidase domain-containing protein [Pedobacter fastidiosus]|uniref:Glycoside hydrolase family 127 protein n=1 Tax=Pedobacter fastidiosus TaxID=2765361 RepID=A0ABR7KYD0_9SPHI|nr:beta-L-arabinofuranosidase domain-containing protein [Pedobacter fastidiosus]MBC6113008.1 glycoside hydrolase family 127 protein [Pedobacter fastidiosus]